AGGEQLALAGGFQGAQNVGGVPAGGEDDEGIAFIAERFDLAREGVFESEVIGSAGEDGRIAQGDGGKRAAIFHETRDQFFAEMHGLGGGTAVAGNQQLVFGVEASEQLLGEARKLWLHCSKNRQK